MRDVAPRPGPVVPRSNALQRWAAFATGAGPLATSAPGLGVQKYGAASPYVTAVGGVFNGEIGNDVLQAGVCGHFLRTMPIGRQLMLLIA